MPKASICAMPRFRFAACLFAAVLLSGCADKRPPGYQGYVEGEFVHAAPAEAGRLQRLLVTRGQTVPAGAPLFVLESERESAAKRQAEQVVKTAEAQLSDLKAGKRPLELDVIRAQLAQAEAVERNSAVKRERDESLFRSGAIPRAQLDATRSESDANSARVSEIRNQLTVAELPARDDQIQAQAAALESARAALDQVLWRLAQKSVSSVQAALVFDTLYREGEWVPAGSPVVRLLPPENVKVRFFVPEPVAGALTVGQDVQFLSDGQTSSIPARVTYISIQPEYTPPIIYSNETRSKLVFMIEAVPVDPRAVPLHPGQPIEVRMR